VPLIIGGVHISAVPEQLLNSNFDFGVIGEGEITFLELLQLYQGERKFSPLALRNIKGVVFRNDKGNLEVTPRRELLSNLDSVPFPALDLLKMKEQYLDRMPLERERGITIKMQPVRMEWQGYVLNLIDTPGHIDFSYEVSRALAAVEGAVLLVDATQGVQAQTLSVVELARSLNLAIIPVINKIDLPQARVAETREEIKNILNCGEDEISEVSARAGQGVRALLGKIAEKVPPPLTGEKEIRALIFDFEYSAHRGVIAHARVFDGEIKKGDRLKFSAAGGNFIVGEVGFFKPEFSPAASLKAGEIGYVVTGIKEAKVVRVGDTIFKEGSPPAGGLAPFSGYLEPKPVVFSSLYPESEDQFDDLRRALERLKLADSSLFFEEESSGVLGRGFRCGFLGMLHLEIVAQRLARDFGVKTIVVDVKERFIGMKSYNTKIHTVL